MGFRDARRRLIAALQAGAYQHEALDIRQEKNLLGLGEIEEEAVITLLRRTRGDQYQNSPHHWDRSTTVHVFRPQYEGERWYIKAYFLESEGGGAVFISVHRQEG